MPPFSKFNFKFGIEFLSNLEILNKIKIMIKIEIFSKNGKLLKKDFLNLKKKEFKIIKINKRKIEASEEILNLKFKIPIIDIHGYWTPDIFLPDMELKWEIKLLSASNINFPFICFVNQSLKNRFAFGSTNLIDDSILVAKINQKDGTYDIDFNIAICKETEEFELVFDLRDKIWTEIINDFRKKIVPSDLYYPKEAYLPVYCSWYAFHADLNQEKIEKQIKIANALGFKTIIIDDGWCFDEKKRVSPETIENWYENIGDWEISKSKFPNFKQHIEKVKKFFGMKYMLWIAPFLIGEKSKIYKENKIKFVSSEKHEGYRLIDPEDIKNIKTIFENILKIFKEYKLDGLKIDFIDIIKPSLEKPKGRIIYEIVKNFIEELKEINSSCLIEFRQKYATPINLNLATQFRASDVPFDFLGNLNRIAHIRLCLGDKVPVHSDPVFWRFEESPLNVAKHMIVSLTGVPMISMDLNKLSQKHRKIIRTYINFYLKNLEIFKNGKWQINYGTGFIKSISVCYGSKMINFLLNEECGEKLKKGFEKEIWFLNLGDKPIFIENSITFDFYGNHYKKNIIPPGGFGYLSHK